MIELLIPIFILSIALVGIHSYFGFEIIKRGIIFTDLAIGQFSALGASIALILFHGEYLYLTSLTFALVGGFLIAIVSNRKQIEAFIGLLYAFALSSLFLILSNTPRGLEVFNELMANDILFTSSGEILNVILLYLFLGVCLFFINRFRGFLREVLFFGIFAITVTSSVKVAGVLVVFALLVAPALIAIKLNRGLGFAWSFGIIVNLTSILISYNFDLPTGYTLVSIHSILAIGIFLKLNKK